MKRAWLVVVIALGAASSLVGCFEDSACVGLECTEEESNASTDEDALSCEELDIDAEGSTEGTGDHDPSAWQWRRCYLFELRENAVLKLTSSSAGHVVPKFTLYVEQAEDVYPDTQSGAGYYGGEIARPLPKGRYALIASSPTRGPYAFWLSADYQTEPSPAQEPADVPGRSDEIVELDPSPTAEVQEYVGPDDTDYYRFALAASSRVSVGFSAVATEGSASVRADVLVDRGEGTTQEEQLGTSYSGYDPVTGVFPAGSYLIKVSGPPSLYTLLLTATTE